MNEKENHTAPKGQYPPFWERVVPLALGIIVVVIIILLLIIIAVALELFPGSG